MHKHDCIVALEYRLQVFLVFLFFFTFYAFLIFFLVILFFALMGNRSSCHAHRVIGASLSRIQELGSNSKGWYQVLEIYDNSEYLDLLFVALMREDSI